MNFKVKYGFKFPSKIIIFSKKKFMNIFNIYPVIIVQCLIEKEEDGVIAYFHIKWTARIQSTITIETLDILIYFFCESNIFLGLLLI